MANVKNKTYADHDILDVIETEEKVTIITVQRKPEESMCPSCGKMVPQRNMRYDSKARQYQDCPIQYDRETVVSALRVEARCPHCGKRHTVPSALIRPNSRMTTYEAAWINFLLQNPYGMTNEEMAAEADVSGKTIRRFKKQQIG